jgi:hypothetical protein
MGAPAKRWHIRYATNPCMNTGMGRKVTDPPTLFISPLLLLSCCEQYYFSEVNEGKG